MTKDLQKKRLNNTTDWRQQQSFQELGSVFECCSLNCVVLDSPMLSALWQW